MSLLFKALLALLVARLLYLLFGPLPPAGGVVVGKSATKRISFVSVNDVYKLVGLPSGLPYVYFADDLDAVRKVASSKCNGETCSSGSLDDCGVGSDWEACFPQAFPQAQERSVIRGVHKDGPQTLNGPCGGEFGNAREYGHMLDFAATFKWLKDEVEAEGGIAIGTLAGDFIAPSYLAEIHRGKQLVEIMNHMQVDLVNIGNHDVDFGLSVLKEQMNRSAFHYLNANLRDLNQELIQQPGLAANEAVEGNSGKYTASLWRTLHPGASGWFGPGFAVLEVGDGIRVCVLGTTDVDKMAWKRKHVDGFQRDIPAAIAILQQWRDENVGCSLQVAMTHTRTGNDLNLFQAAELRGLHLDAIIGGHDHYAAFAELARSDGGKTFLVKAGADARIISKLTFDVSSQGRASGVQELVPVVTGSCRRAARGDARKAWFRKVEEIYFHYAKHAEDAQAVPLNIRYRGLYDTSFVRSGESMAVNMWLDLMRESLSADAVFFQAGLVRQDMAHDFGPEGVVLSELFMLEEFPWGDDDVDARSSLFPFSVSVEDLVTKTLPWMARRYWCSAPFNDANRIHMSGFLVELLDEASCRNSNGARSLRSISFVGGCHKRGSLQLPVDISCCSSPVCGRLWSRGDWDQRVTDDIRRHNLTVLTGQFCDPSKYATHGGGFHDVGMACSGAEPGSASTSRLLAPGSLATAYAAEDFERYGLYFKPAIRSMLKRLKEPVQVGQEKLADCETARAYYEANTFDVDCKCAMQAGDVSCPVAARAGGFPRFYAATQDHRS